MFSADVAKVEVEGRCWAPLPLLSEGKLTPFNCSRMYFFAVVLNLSRGSFLNKKVVTCCTLMQRESIHGPNRVTKGICV